MDGQTPSGHARTCIFTICSRNYLHAARTLLSSVARFAPAADRVLALCDEANGIDPVREPFEILPIEQLPLPAPGRFLFRYTVLELNTAIKPWVFQTLLDRGYERIVYFDPDIEVFAPLDDMLARLDRSEVLLTPHVTAPLADAGRPSDLDLLVCGTYNLGYVALRRSDDTRRLVQWWQRKLEFDCVVDMKRGLFVDQKWMDMAPALCAQTEVVHHPGWNVAYWNLPHRTLRENQGTLTSNGEPLVFFHFSGYDPDRGEFSRHQDRFTLDSLPDTVRSLCDRYAANLRRHGYPATRQQPYAFASFADGTVIPDLARRIYRENESQIGGRYPEPRTADAGAFIAYCNDAAAPLGGVRNPLITRIAREVYETRDDLFLRAQFPDLAGAHAVSFAGWFTGAGRAFHRLPDPFVAPVAAALASRSRPASTGATPNRGFGKWLYQTAWRFKDLTHAFVPLQTRQRIAAWLFRRAYVSPTAEAAAPASAAWKALPQGLNVIGYLRAELGVGEAARATLRACAAANVPAAAIDFRKGAASRMEEEIPGTFGSDPKYGITLLHLNAEQVPHAVADCEAALKDRRVIAYWNWELPELPESWIESTRFLHEIWAPSRFCQTAFSRRLNLPVTHIPYAIDVRVPPGIGRAQLGVPEDGFVFLYMFDALSVPERKNPMAVVEAFERARPQFRRPAWLVLKMINGDRESALRRRLEEARTRTPGIVTLERYFRRPELNALFAAADCYVSLHRAEGYGLTLAESMFLGKPVIATGWSANMDFMTPWNSVPVPYRLVQIERDHGPYPAGQWWAEPEVEAAGAAMVRMVNEPEFAHALGRQAARDIRSDLSPEAVGTIIRKRIDHMRR